MKLKQTLAMCLACVCALTMLSGCTKPADAAATPDSTTAEAAKPLTLEQITEAAKKEGEIVSIGMPDSWANWKDTWNDISTTYGLKHTDTDMSSAEEIAKFEAEKDKPTADIGDVGITFAPIAVEKGVVQPYKPSTWDEIPDWAKDTDGNWAVAYTGTIAFITNKKLVDAPPKSWDDVLKGTYKVAVGDVGKAAQANNAILACALAHGGDETNLEPAYTYFGELAKNGRLSLIEPSLANLEKGEVEVAILWDFNALNYRDQIAREGFDVAIPAEGSVISGYATIINKYAPHPNAAMLAREYIFSDAGQINLAKGYARPIRTNVKLPEEVQQMMLPQEQYTNTKPVKDYTAWNETGKTIAENWQSKVLVNAK